MHFKSRPSVSRLQHKQDAQTWNSLSTEPCSNILPYHIRTDIKANTVDPDQMLHRVSSDQGLLCLLLIKVFLDTSTSTKMHLLEF